LRELRIKGGEQLAPSSAQKHQHCTYRVLPEKKLTVEKINGQEAAHSDYVSRFKEHGFESDRGRLVFW
jgi:hypothetical protein